MIEGARWWVVGLKVRPALLGDYHLTVPQAAKNNNKNKGGGG